MKMLALLCFSFFLLYAQKIESKQLLVVTSQTWEAPIAVLERYELHHGKWKKAGDAIEVKIGRNGMGWGLGLHKVPNSAVYIKKEGDGKSPAGIFKLKQGFGYTPLKSAYPYIVYKETDHCVDDVNSKFYNQIVDSTAVEKEYQSYEVMKFPKNYYKYGIVVAHNAQKKKGAGSCIFIHIKDVPTAGCTVMSEKQMKELLLWLDPAANPLLIQAPKEEIKKLLEEISFFES